MFVPRRLVQGNSPYRATHDRLVARAIGMPRRPIIEYRIKPPGLCSRAVEIDGRKHCWPDLAEPFLPTSFDEPYHPGGNSLCYMVQTACILGAGLIYALGFTLQHGSTYFFGREHPLRGGGPVYDTERALHWLSWFESQKPGCVRLLSGFSGPIYDVLRTEDIDAYRRNLAGPGSEPEGAGAAARIAEPLHADGDSGQPSPERGE